MTDLEKISFYFAIPIKDLKAVLNTKEFKL